MMVATLAFLVLSRPVTIRLESLKAGYTVGEQFQLSAKATNRSADPIFLIRQGDGGQSGMKAPYCQIEVKQPDATWATPRLPAMCGNTNPIKGEDFVNVPPGKSIELLGDWWWPLIESEPLFQKPGVCRIRLRYDSTPPIERWIGGPLPLQNQDELIRQVMPLFRKVPKGEFISNEVQIRITAKS